MTTPTDATLEEVLDRSRTLAGSGVRRILGIAGPPGAGKSYLAEELAAALGPDLAVVVPMDGFHLAQEVLETLGRAGRKGAADTFDGEGYVALLRRLRHQVAPRTTTDAALDGVVLAPRFHRDLEEPVGSAIAVRPDVPLVITEGNYLLRPQAPWIDARELLDEVWFLAPPQDLRQERLVARHVSFGRSREAATEHALGSDEVNAREIAATAQLADLVLRLVESP